jgi:hypothetical protein
MMKTFKEILAESEGNKMLTSKKTEEDLKKEGEEAVVKFNKFLESLNSIEISAVLDYAHSIELVVATEGDRSLGSSIISGRTVTCPKCQNTFKLKS